jgi:PleD family two-component response regulator
MFVGDTDIKPVDIGVDDALTRADRGLYRARECGRNRVTVEV